MRPTVKGAFRNECKSNCTKIVSPVRQVRHFWSIAVLYTESDKSISHE